MARRHVDESFVDDWDDVMTEVRKERSDFYVKWTEQASAKHTDAVLMAFEALRKLYPKHSIVSTDDFRLKLVNFPGAQVTPLKDNPLVTSIGFSSLSRTSAPVPGVLTDRIIAGGFTLKWQNKDFILHVVQYPVGMIGFSTQSFVLHEGPEEPARQLLLACGLWANAAHYEVWVFNQGNWQKDGALWDSIQKADWKDIILKETFKKSFQKDVFGFYDSERLYKELGIPWKRGLIMYGPPGNGKTITLKAVMKTCDAKGYTPLYVKSFQSFAGDEYSMRVVFSKARQSAPCVLILEDLDSLITDRNRSFFLNELDGLETNDGILVLATTNHFDRLDPGLSSRPSRFDRKYLFDDPDQEERTLYAVYWQKKLKNNHSIEFPDTLVDEIAEATEQFSFAYLKEAFVSALVILAGLDENEDKPSFRTVLMEQIDVLRKQLDKPEAVIPAVSIEEGKAQDLPSLPVVVPPISRPLPHPGRRFYTENIRRQTTSGNGASQVIVPPSPPLLPIGPFDPRSAEAQHQLNSDMMALRARLSALRVPGGFGNPEEDEFAIPSLHIPSPQSQSVNRSLPGMSGYWA